MVVSGGMLVTYDKSTWRIQVVDMLVSTNGSLVSPLNNCVLGTAKEAHQSTERMCAVEHCPDLRDKFEEIQVIDKQLSLETNIASARCPFIWSNLCMYMSDVIQGLYFGSGHGHT